jgi:hypothetical protein
MTSNTGSKDNGAKTALTLRTLCYFGIGIAVIALLALMASQAQGFLAAIGIGALIVLTSAAVGAVLGFLFALPRILSHDPKEESAPAAVDSSATEKRSRLLGSNTNLERVSDWLTTMIVGVGLTQVGQVNSALYDFRLFIAETATVFSGPDCDSGCSAGTLPMVGPMLLIFGLVGGFVALYLYTRLKLSDLFHDVEKNLNYLSGEPALAVRQTATAASVIGGAAENPAIQAVLASRQPTVDEGLNLMLSLLYRPNGYQQVIDLGGRLSNTLATKRPEYWFYLAAAFGQKHGLLVASGAPAEDIQSAKDNALDCARRAVERDSLFKDRLWDISDPQGMDDDLSELRDDPSFRKLVGK